MKIFISSLFSFFSLISRQWRYLVWSFLVWLLADKILLGILLLPEMSVCIWKSLLPFIKCFANSVQWMEPTLGMGIGVLCGGFSLVGKLKHKKCVGWSIITDCMRQLCTFYIWSLPSLCLFFFSQTKGIIFLINYLSWFLAWYLIFELFSIQIRFEVWNYWE